MVRFVNGDLKRVEGGTGVVIYTYAAARTTHTMHPSGLEVFEFPNGQVIHSFVVKSTVTTDFAHLRPLWSMTYILPFLWRNMPSTHVLPVTGALFGKEKVVL